ncbi:MAG: V-type ATP synthase subunit I [Chlamydiia bacterium]|nr:V-type ATP synthase subunit I [Chlamydiia bacterium]
MKKKKKKILFYGLEEDREAFFSAAQHLGLIDFIDLTGFKQQELPTDLQHHIQAIKILRHQPQKEQSVAKEVREVVDQIIHLKQTIDILEEEKRLLRLDIGRVRVFGDFHLIDLKYLEKHTGKVFQFFHAKKNILKKGKIPDDLIYVGTDHGLLYFVAFNDKPKQYDRFVEMKIEQPLGQLLKRQQEVNHEIRNAENQLRELATYEDFLRSDLIHQLNHNNLNMARTYARHTMEGSLFTVQGWIPVNHKVAIKKLAKQHHIVMEEIAVEEKDRPPTYLENKGASRIGEDLIDIYDTPATTDRDPSLWVLLSFTLFFAMIIGDAGYGSAFLGLALFLRFKFPKLKGMKKRILNLFTLLCASCIIWGVMTCSFFGYTVGYDHPLRNVSAIQWLAKQKANYHIQEQDKTFTEWTKQYPSVQTAKNGAEILQSEHALLSSTSNSILLELSLLFGSIHVILSLLRYVDRNYAAIGWILFIIGGYLYIPDYLGVPSLVNILGGIDLETTARYGKELLGLGLGVATLFAVRENHLLGLADVLSNVIQIFSDILSYLRLYALGLSGAILANTVNEAVAVSGVVFGVFLFVIGHVVNMALGIMSGVIHGLRLNFLEWYHYSFEGGGKKFKPLHLIHPE